MKNNLKVYWHHWVSNPVRAGQVRTFTPLDNVSFSYVLSYIYVFWIFKMCHHKIVCAYYNSYFFSKMFFDSV